MFYKAEQKIRVGVVLGTRPEAIKLAPVITALAQHPMFEPFVISTGQHRDMVTAILADFGITADVDLDLMAPGQSLNALAGAAISRIDEVLTQAQIQQVIVQGDTTTAVAGAMAGFYAQIPVAHVEAGLRTDDRFSPFPEEVNRRMIAPLVDLHFAPTAHAAERLRAEGIDDGAIVQSGNTVVDALFATVARELPYRGPEALALQRVEPLPTLLVTAHRRESWDGGIAAIAEAVERIVSRHPELQVVFPLHPNPAVRAQVIPRLGGLEQVVLTEPLGYADFVRVLRSATLVLTDSGGIQEEACSLGIPTLVARDTSERMEGADAGGLLLVGTDADRIATDADRVLSDPLAREALVCRSLPFGDGHAAERIVEALSVLPTPARVG